MYARPQEDNLTDALLTALVSVQRLAALSRALRQLSRLLVLVPLICISLLYGTTHAGAPRLHVDTPAPHEAIQRPALADHTVRATLTEAEVVEQPSEATPDADDELEPTHSASCPPPYAAWLVRLHPARAPPAALHPRHHLGFEHLLATTRLRASAPSRAPPLA